MRRERRGSIVNCEFRECVLCHVVRKLPSVSVSVSVAVAASVSVPVPVSAAVCSPLYTSSRR